MRPGEIFRELSRDAAALAEEGCQDPASMIEYSQYLENLGRLADLADAKPPGVSAGGEQLPGTLSLAQASASQPAEAALIGLNTFELRGCASLCWRRAAAADGEQRRRWLALEAKLSDLAETIERAQEEASVRG